MFALLTAPWWHWVAWRPFYAQDAEYQEALTADQKRAAARAAAAAEAARKEDERKAKARQ